ncbi:histidine phosphatase family protein [Aurantimonas sp. VKM B-3413]|uniref:histidine phosphatase family protein n=1 Tax=Aurantimonas sp. VKM B-3413 TaxID=2779401 RepID=UPI001E54A46C|nr:histidine phosphatase family protein [Aurantimonas sp. VKM B-3413]MCB8840473.1 histidine phosphatase family protein [Aurantimonas sp. VKM B-3413]
MRQAASLLSIALIWLTASLNPAAAADAWQAARAEGTHILMRHAIAPGTGDPADFALGDCSTQRNLSQEGREQARRIGERLQEKRVPVAAVLTSQWCRARDTAEELDLGAPAAEPALNSFFGDRPREADQTAALKARLRELDEAGRKAVLVTHQVNITALTGVFPASGEIVVISLGPNGAVTVDGRIRTE